MKSHSTTMIIILLLFNEALTRSVLSPVTTGRRFQFLLFGENGGYRYGYYHNDGKLEAQQTSDSSDSEHYIYTNSLGRNVQVNHVGNVQKFGRQGDNIIAVQTSTPSYSPEHIPSNIKGTDKGQYIGNSADDVNKNKTGINNATKESNDKKTNNVVNVLNSDGSFFFSYASSGSSRMEASDANNNVQGKYSYTDEAGEHDLTYVAGKETGFVVTGGNLAIPNGLKDTNLSVSESPVFYSVPFESSPYNDSSYSFEYATPLHSRQEIGDNKGNVYGRYSFVNEQGSHDLRYIAGSSTGFLPIDGSLVQSGSASLQQNEVRRTNKSTYGDSGLIAKSNLHLPLTASYENSVARNQKSPKEDDKLTNSNNFKMNVTKNTSKNYTNAFNESGMEKSLKTDFANKMLRKSSLPTSVSHMRILSKNSAHSTVGYIILPSVVIYSHIPSYSNQQYGYMYDTTFV